MIIGGGVAGMEAARVCALRGHTVALYEASDKLGGNLNPAGVPDFKEDDRALIKWYENELFVHGIEVNMNTEINKEMVLDMHPDTVFVATGSRPVKLKLPGIDKENVYNAIEVLLGEKEVGSTCVIVGGGLVGAELALWLATKGKKVTILEVLNDILQAGAPLVAMNNWMLRDLLKLHKVDIKTNSCIVGVTNQGVIIKTQNGEEFLGVDTVIMAVGSKKENRLYEELKFDISEIFNIGDSREVRNIQGSIWDAYEVARSI
jgi:2-enoate reductase